MGVFKYFIRIRSIYNHKGALLYGANPVCALGEAEHPGHLNVRGVLRQCVPHKGLHPLCRESGGSVNAFCIVNCLTNTPLNRALFYGNSTQSKSR